MRFVASTFIATTLLIPQGVTAAITDNGNITSDSSTNLEWYDVNLTVNKSFEDVNGQFGEGGLFEGWRYATAAEVATFWRNAGIPDVPGDSEANFGPVSSLIALVGVTRTFDVYTWTNGMVSDSSSAERVLAPALFIDECTGTASTSLSAAFAVTDRFATLGSWLVRDASPSDPPEPEPQPTAHPSDMLAELMENLEPLGLQKGLMNSLAVKLREAMKNLDDGNEMNNGGAIGKLSAFLHEVKAQTGKHLTATQAGQLSSKAQAIIDALTG